MGQQCATNSTAEIYELSKRGPGIKIQGNGQNIYSPRKSSVYHFEKSTMQSRISPTVQQIQSALGTFQPSKTFISPKGTIESSSYILNEEGLIYGENGEWKNGMPHGRGEMIYPDGSYYVGYIENGIPHGEGRFVSSDGWYYQGELKNQQAQGQGKFVYEKYGCEHEGNWVGDLPDGFGRQTWRKNNTVSIYEGQFLNGIKHGHGKYTTPTFTYEGRFEKNTLNGKGRVVYKSGQIYEGNFLNGKKHGYGTYRWPDNSQFEGIYQNDIKNGIGKYTNPNGKTFQGRWIHGKREGQGVVTHKNKKHYYDWKNGSASPEKKKMAV